MDCIHPAFHCSLSTGESQSIDSLLLELGNYSAGVSRELPAGIYNQSLCLIVHNIGKTEHLSATLYSDHMTILHSI